MYVCIDASHVGLIKRYYYSASVAALRIVRGHASFAALPTRAVPQGALFAIRAPARIKCDAGGVPTDTDTAQGKWFESALQVGAQAAVLEQLCGG